MTNMNSLSAREILLEKKQIMSTPIWPLSTLLKISFSNIKDNSPCKEKSVILEYFKGKPFVACLKYDGVSASFILRKRNSTKSNEISEEHNNTEMINNANANINNKGNNKEPNIDDFSFIKDRVSIKNKALNKTSFTDLNNNINSINNNNTSTFLPDTNDDNYEFLACSRNFIREEANNVYSDMASKYFIKDILLKYKGQFSLQGEVYGKNILNNPHELQEQRLVIFNVFDSFNERYLDYEEMKAFCEHNSLSPVKLIDSGESFNYSVDKLQEKTKGFYEGTTNQIEGLVYRLKHNWFRYDKELIKNLILQGKVDKELDSIAVNGIRFSFKIVNNEYLLKKHEEEKKEDL
eukprot:CAMPEP_0170536906 /NCGR_PEP_ID=MMETSP0209-20121228/102411_1 /TAXON_ID=665100 ORGANISM="Litonotus pictus, Strain P1" /NCGR_SAMPLE_ID=MMETSP0209 /ASSEMBLY_ACC=CAM_ASM_000301 /LENGTH=349 /DNA_ID=CAMNT_0010838325 /DNA_START=960 /DNA_END=2010 /DNA_ORIENTATION=-